MDPNSAQNTTTSPNSPNIPLKTPANPTQPANNPQNPSPTTPIVTNKNSTTTQSVITPNFSQDATPQSKSKNGKVIFGFFLILLFLIVVGIGGFSWALAYQKISLPKYPKVQLFVQQSIIGLPFMPKTPKYLIAKSGYAHKNVTKHSFDLSIALESDGFSEAIGMNRFDLSTIGKIDYSNPEDINFYINANLSKDFSLDLSKSDKFLYFKVNKLPSFLLAFLGLNSDIFNPLLNKWVAYDTTTLTTEASKELKDKEVNTLSFDLINEIDDKYFDEFVVKKIKIEKLNEDGYTYYKMSLTTDKELLDYIDEKIINKGRSGTLYSNINTAKMSDYIKNIEFNMYIDNKTYLTHKISIKSEMEFDEGIYPSALLGTSSNFLSNSKVNFAFVAKLDDFGKDLIIETPSEYMSYEEFTKNLSQIMVEVYQKVYSTQTPIITPSNPISEVE